MGSRSMKACPWGMPHMMEVFEGNMIMSSNYWFINAVGGMVSSSGIPYQEYSYVGPEVIATAKETSEEVQCLFPLVPPKPMLLKVIKMLLK